MPVSSYSLLPIWMFQFFLGAIFFNNAAIDQFRIVDKEPTHLLFKILDLSNVNIVLWLNGRLITDITSLAVLWLKVDLLAFSHEWRFGHVVLGFFGLLVLGLVWLFCCSFERTLWLVFGWHGMNKLVGLRIWVWFSIVWMMDYLV